jgi:hypothetical protein
VPKKLDPKKAEKLMLKAGLKPLEPYTNTKVKWKCRCFKCKKIISPTLTNVRNTKIACAYCATVKIDEIDAINVMIKAGLKPLDPYKNSATKWKCRCQKCKRIVRPTYSSIQQGQGGCEYCAGKKVDPKEVIKLMARAQLKPLELYKSSKSKFKCECLKCGSIVYPHYADIKQGQGGCIPCGYNQRIDPNKISVEDARLIMAKNNIKPIGQYLDSASPWKARCLKCKNTIYPRVTSVKRGDSCRYCAGVRVSSAQAEKIMIKAKLKPLAPYTTGKKKWKCRCLKCRKIVYPNYSQIAQGVGGCRYCRKFGIEMLEPSYIYLITNKSLGSHKIGIANRQTEKRKDRLAGSKGFLRFGWSAYKIWNFDTGETVVKIETGVFRIIRKELNLPIHLSKTETPISGGHSETINADSITLLELEKIIKKVIKGLKE